MEIIVSLDYKVAVLVKRKCALACNEHLIAVGSKTVDVVKSIALCIDEAGECITCNVRSGNGSKLCALLEEAAEYLLACYALDNGNIPDLAELIICKELILIAGVLLCKTTERKHRVEHCNNVICKCSAAELALCGCNVLKYAVLYKVAVLNSILVNYDLILVNCFLNNLACIVLLLGRNLNLYGLFPSVNDYGTSRDDLGHICSSKATVLEYKVLSLADSNLICLCGKELSILILNAISLGCYAVPYKEINGITLADRRSGCGNCKHHVHLIRVVDVRVRNFRLVLRSCCGRSSFCLCCHRNYRENGAKEHNERKN